MKHTNITRRAQNVTVIRAFRQADIEVWTTTTDGETKLIIRVVGKKFDYVSIEQRKAKKK